MLPPATKAITANTTAEKAAQHEEISSAHIHVALRQHFCRSETRSERRRNVSKAGIRTEQFVAQQSDIGHGCSAGPCAAVRRSRRMRAWALR